MANIQNLNIIWDGSAIATQNMPIDLECSPNVPVKVESGYWDTTQAVPVKHLSNGSNLYQLGVAIYDCNGAIKYISSDSFGFINSLLKNACCGDVSGSSIDYNNNVFEEIVGTTLILLASEWHSVTITVLEDITAINSVQNIPAGYSQTYNSSNLLSNPITIDATAGRVLINGFKK